MLEGKTRVVSVKSAILISMLFLLLGAFPLLSGCAQESVNRSEGQFPNVPALLDRLATSSNEDFTEELNLVDGSSGFKSMADLNGWKGYEEILFLATHDDDDGTPEVNIMSAPSDEGNDGYLVLPNGNVMNGTDPTVTPHEYVDSVVDDPLGVEELFCEPLTANPNFDNESEVALTLLKDCGVSESNIKDESQQYTKSSPLNAMEALLEGEVQGSAMFGSAYQVVGEGVTPQGRTFYYSVYVREMSDLMYVDAEGLSYISVPKAMDVEFSANFQLNEPIELMKYEEYSLNSNSPIDNKDVFLYMSDSADSATTQESSSSESTMAYKAADSADATDMAYVLIVEDNIDWSICLRSVVDGAAPEFFDDGTANGQGVMGGTIDSDGVAVPDDVYGDFRLKFDYDSKGIKVTCTKGSTSTVEDIEGYYYFDINEAV